MAQIRLMVGFLGFGKTTIAKKLEKELSAVRYTHDEIMLSRYGRNPDDFQTKYNEVDAFIRQAAAKDVQNGKNVILDYGFWNHKVRKEYFEWAKNLTKDVVFDVVCCDLAVAKARVLKRSATDEKALLIDENAFNVLYERYKPWSDEDKYPAVFYDTNG